MGSFGWTDRQDYTSGATASHARKNEVRRQILAAMGRPGSSSIENDHPRRLRVRYNSRIMPSDNVLEPADEPLPTPAERPEADIVIYDGHCRICTSQVRKLPRWDCQGRLAYLSLHDPEVASRWPDLSHERLMREMVIIDADGSRHWGAEAIRYLSRRLRRLWWASPLLHFPGSMYLWRPLYNWIARNRYRIRGEEACDEGTCTLHR
jgi:predicted DCC family thiol-disulfide oxidoreductase YuxK